MKNNLISLLAFALLVIGFSACQKESVTPNESQAAGSETLVADRSNTVVDIALANPDFSALVAAVVKTGQVELLSSANLNATVFAPTNAAFAELPAPLNNAANINGITDPATINTLRQVIRYHLVRGRRTAQQLTNGNYQTLKNAPLPGANMVTVGRDVNGGVFINGNVQVVAADVIADNGVIHVVNKVILPANQDIIQIARANGSFTALVAALEKTRLVNTLTMPTGSWTVFAPTDAAFAQLPAPLNNAQNIRNISDGATINTLRNVLLYHVVRNSRIFSVDLRENLTVATGLPGANVTTFINNGPMIKGNGNPMGSNVVAANILATNGVVHVIDSVLLP